MSTTAEIILHEPNGKVTTILCNEGSPRTLGAMLADHYEDVDRVRALLSLGDLSFVGPKVSPTDPCCHSFEYPEDGATVAYGRDRDADWGRVAPRFYESLKDALSANRGEPDYIYLFDAESREWYIGKTSDVRRDFEDWGGDAFTPLWIFLKE